MSLGDEWSETNPGSASKLNLTTLTFGTGAYLAGLDKTKHKLLVCTSTGSGYTLDHTYLCKTDGTGVIDIGVMQPHEHSSDSTGGSLSEILIENSLVIDSGAQFMLDMNSGNWSSAVTGTGASTAVTNYVNGTDYSGEEVLKMSTGATSGSGANWKISGMPVDYGEGDSQFQAVVAVSSTTNINARGGFNCETITSADDNARKYGFNLCTSVNGNWFARSANGTTRSDADMGIAFDTSPTNITAHLREADDEIDYYVNFANKLTKTSDIPLSGSGARENLVRFGVKNNTAADRQMHAVKLRFTYYTTTEWW